MRRMYCDECGRVMDWPEYMYNSLTIREPIGTSGKAVSCTDYDLCTECLHRMKENLSYARERMEARERRADENEG